MKYLLLFLASITINQTTFSQINIKGNWISCDSKVYFELNSTNIVDSAVWNWGDGNFSTGLTASHQYSFTGIYNIQIYLYHTSIIDTIIPTQPLLVNSTGNCNINSNYCCNYGISNVQINDFQNVSSNAFEGNRNFECLDAITIPEGNKLYIQINNNFNIIQDFKIWIDIDGDGDITQNELIYSKTNSLSVNDSILLPANLPINSNLKLVLGSDIPGSNFEYCSSISRGQFETYTIRISQSNTKPNASFTTHLNNNFTCNGYVNFLNNSSNNSTSFLWDFGNGDFSTDFNPAYKYLSSGNYWVKLIASNSYGSDTFSLNNPINVTLNSECDTISIPSNNTFLSDLYCNAIITDDGIKNNYSNNSFGKLIIAPNGAKSLTIKFKEFSYENGFDFLEIYDGPNSNYPIIGKFTGTTLPNSGTIQSTGPSLFLQQITDDVYTQSGFIAQLLCQLDNTESQTINFSLFPNPTNTILNISNSELLMALKIRDISGNLLITSYNNPIDISHLSQGIYFIEIITMHNSTILKWIKSN